MTIGQHLESLRRHVLRAVLYIMVALGICLFFQKPLMRWAIQPHRGVVEELQQEIRVNAAPNELRDLLTEASAADGALERTLAEVVRDEARLRERLDPSSERLVGLRAEQERLAAALRAHQAGVAEREASGELDREGIAAIASAREALTAQLASVRRRVEHEVDPFLDRYAAAPRLELIQLRYQETFLAFIKLALVAALFLASPLVAREMWRFVAVGLYPHEKRYVNLFAPMTFFAFILGGMFGYFVLIPLGLKFLATYAPPDMIAGTFSLSDYLSLFVTLTLVVGLVFELPLFMTFLTLIGVMSAEKFRKYRKYWLLSAFVMAAFLTPPDPVTQTLMAIPLVTLYEVGILTSAFVGRRKPRGAGPDDPDPGPRGARALPPPSTPPAPPQGTAPLAATAPATSAPESPSVGGEAAPSSEASPSADADAAATSVARPMDPRTGGPADELIRPVAEPTIARGPAYGPPPAVRAEPDPYPEEDAGGEGGSCSYVSDGDDGDNPDPTLAYLGEEEPEPEPPEGDDAGLASPEPSGDNPQPATGAAEPEAGPLDGRAEGSSQEDAHPEDAHPDSGGDQRPG